jgi:hypothetical protein
VEQPPTPDIRPRFSHPCSSSHPWVLPGDPARANDRTERIITKPGDRRADGLGGAGRFAATWSVRRAAPDHTGDERSSAVPVAHAGPDAGLDHYPGASPDTAGPGTHANLSSDPESRKNAGAASDPVMLGDTWRDAMAPVAAGQSLGNAGMRRLG